MIPKIIFQTHEYKYKDLPNYLKNISLSWQNLNPGWEYIYHDRYEREKFVSTNSPELYKLYKKVTKPHQADIWRYLILFINGGVYADMDSFCITPMDYILQGLSEKIDVVSTKLESDGGTNNANFAACKESIILNKCIEEILEKSKDKKNMRILHETFSKNIASNKNIVSDIMVASHSMDYKKEFDQNNIEINYYGKKMYYSSFLLS
jgi:mannosyltransferase OCH1-like enzyme